jgi:type II secretory pathway component GspD/PulD (secretin)
LRHISLISFVLFTSSAFAFVQTAATQETPAATPAASAKVGNDDARATALRHRDLNLDPLRVYRLQAGSGAEYGNEILTGMRLMLDSSCKFYLMPEQNTILLRCAPEYFDIADKVVRELDRVKPNYRLTYTVVESDNGKRLGVQHFALTMIPGVRTTLKDGSKVPVVTGSYSAGAAAAGVQTQFTYLDIGLNFDATLDQGADGLRLSSKVEQSGSSEDRTITGVTEPIIRQAVLVGSATLQVGKPLMLGTLDIAGSTRHLDVEVLLEVIK